MRGMQVGKRMKAARRFTFHLSWFIRGFPVNKAEPHTVARVRPRGRRGSLPVPSLGFKVVGAHQNQLRKLGHVAGAHFTVGDAAIRRAGSSIAGRFRQRHDEGSATRSEDSYDAALKGKDEG